MKEYPQNVVTPTTRDLEPNTCPVHANARRLIKSLHNAVVALGISVPCRHMVAGTKHLSSSHKCKEINQITA